jgi:hypothetical protein
MGPECLAMMITITTSGGIGGFGLAKSAEVAVDALPEPLQVEVCARLDPAALGALDVSRVRGADRIVYHIVVSEAGEAKRFDVPESALPGATLDLIDQLLQRAAGR